MSRVIPLLAFVLAIGAVAVQGCLVPAEYTDLAAKVRSICLGESGTTADVVDGTCAGNFPDDANLKAYLKCIVTQLDMLSGEDINYDIVIGMIPAAAKDRLTQAVNGCRGESGSDLNDKIYNIVKCIYKADTADFFMP